uniref:ABC transmembrane type-2 domain-containing protein n=1 Tax=Bornetia secundiflora TaxID=2575637 RepID=A0A4D6WMK1_9FLOR|nr:hypothetical protein [Bornetia secundiflora]
MFTSDYNKDILSKYSDLQYRYQLKPILKIHKSLPDFRIYKEITTLTKRLYIQLYRRPITIVVGMIQPLLWIILFSALFRNMPITLLAHNIQYGEFLSPGIIIFTAFTGSMNAGLPIVFDREFGFLNRLLASPLITPHSLMLSSLVSIWTTTITQTISIIACSIILFHNISITSHIYVIVNLSTSIIMNMASISICLAFILPGHIEFLAFLLITNLPVLFSSTALAPLPFMPYWLQLIACTNPLTYAIEILRDICIQRNNNALYIIETVWINLNLYQSICILTFLSIISFITVNYIITYKYE